MNIQQYMVKNEKDQYLHLNMTHTGVKVHWCNDVHLGDGFSIFGAVHAKREYNGHEVVVAEFKFINERKIG
jgi:hypothetical protein